MTLRSAIEIGSGGPKLRVGLVSDKGKIVEVVSDHQIYVPLQESLSRSDGCSFSSHVMESCLHAISNLIEIARARGTQDIVIVGTSAFRKASNGIELCQSISDRFNCPMHIVDQQTEAKLAYTAVSATTDIDPKNLIVWDIGGYSTQWISCDLYVGTDDGSGPFKDAIIRDVQRKDLAMHPSPNPISSEEAEAASIFVQQSQREIQSVLCRILERSDFRCVGVGNVLSRSVAEAVGRCVFDVEDLRQVITSLLGLSDEKLGGGVYAWTKLSNLLLVKASMEALGIVEVETRDINIADGALVYAPFWVGEGTANPRFEIR